MKPPPSASTSHAARCSFLRSASTAALLLLSTLPSPARAQQAAPVDDEALLDADPTEWLSYGRDYAETHYSPLDGIDADNVHRLGLAWSSEIRGTAGRLEATPLVSDGVMYASGTWSVLFALDARTGEEIWRWDPAIVRGGRRNGGPSVCCGPVNRGVALYRGRVYAGLLDGRLVALDAETGDVVWVRQTTPRGGEYSITQAPRIVKGNVVIGNSGAEYGVRGYVSAYDAESGELQWRFHTVPGDPANGFESEVMAWAAGTWAGEWWKLGGGGTVWDGMAYDPEADILYVGTGNGAPWSREHRSAGQGDNLFLASILALDPDDGDLYWHYQTVPGDDWDYTATQNIVLAELTVDGEERPVLMQAPKNGFFYVLDRLTGELISAEPFTHVTWAERIDMETGRPVETPEARYDERGAWLAPGPGGAHNWRPMSWNPDTGLVYIPGRNDHHFYRRNPYFSPVPGRFNTGLGGDRPREVEEPPAPEPPGFLLAWDPVAGEERWRIPYDQGRNGGTLTTAGGLVFTGTATGRFLAYDARTGEELFEEELAPGIGTPMTYELGGRQYVTVMAGQGESQGAEGRIWTFVLDGSAPMPAVDSR